MQQAKIISSTKCTKIGEKRKLNPDPEASKIRYAPARRSDKTQRLLRNKQSKISPAWLPPTVIKSFGAAATC